MAGNGARPEEGYRFPAGFRWGTATSSFQVEGDNTNNDWWAWEQLSGKVAEGHRSGRACDWWNGRAEEDFARAEATSQNAHRLSVEWSRVEPRTGVWDGDALDRYRQMARALRARGIEPMVTLHHFTNPLWLAEMGGWGNPSVVPLFERYVRKVVAALRDQVDLWCTINEPNVYLYCVHIHGVFPPGRHGFPNALRTVSHMVKAHAAAYHAIHELQPGARVGFAISVRIYDPARPDSPLDRAVAWLHHRLANELFPAAAHDGLIRLPVGFERVRGAAGTMDYLGVNYYTRDLVAFTPWPWQGFHRRFSPPEALISDGGYGEIHPEGLYHSLRWAARFGLPIFITENGLPDAIDRHRPRFLVTHIYQAWRALRAGIPLLGYYYWTLVDNFEWERGWTSRFGLWALNPETQARTLRRGGEVYAEICAANAVTPELVIRHAPDLE